MKPKTDFEQAILQIARDLQTDSHNLKNFAELELRILKATQDLGRVAVQELSLEVMEKAVPNQKKLVQPVRPTKN
jgi:hypothetical protein